MLIYNSILFVMIITFLSIEKKYFKDIYYIIVPLFFLYFPFIVGINSATPDYDNYVREFNKLPVLFSSLDYFSKITEARTEEGFNILAGIIKLFINSATIFFIILCFLSFIFRFCIIKFFVHKEDIILILFSFLAHEFLRKDCIQIRNGIASAMVLFSFIFLFQGKKIIFCVWVLIASSFHTVALVALPLAGIDIFSNRKFIRLMQYIFILSLLSVSFFKIKDIFFILEKFHILPDSIRNYLYWDIYSKPMPIYHPVVLKQIAICLFFLFIKKKYLLESNKKTIFLFKIYFVSTLYYLFFLDFEILAGRFGSLFYGVETIFLLQIIYSGNFKQKILMKLAVFALICLSFFSNLATLPSTLSFKATFQ